MLPWSQKFAHFGNARDSVNDLRCLGAAVSGSTLTENPANLPTEFATCSLSKLRLLAVLPEPTGVVVALAVGPPLAAGDPSQPLPWSCQPISNYVARQNSLVSEKPEDVTTSDHLYQRAATKVRTTTGKPTTHCSRHHDAIWFSCNRAVEF